MEGYFIAQWLKSNGQNDTQSRRCPDTGNWPENTEYVGLLLNILEKNLGAGTHNEPQRGSVRQKAPMMSVLSGTKRGSFAAASCIIGVRALETIML